MFRDSRSGACFRLRAAGRRLLEETVRQAERRGIERISLSVEAENPAIHLYSDLGFVEVARIADSPTMVLDRRTG